MMGMPLNLKIIYTYYILIIAQAQRIEFKFDPYGDKQWRHATPNGIARWICMRL